MLTRRRGTTSPSCLGSARSARLRAVHYPHMAERTRVESHTSKAHAAAAVAERATNAVEPDYVSGSDPKSR